MRLPSGVPETVGVCELHDLLRAGQAQQVRAVRHTPRRCSARPRSVRAPQRLSSSDGARESLMIGVIEGVEHDFPAIPILIVHSPQSLTDTDTPRRIDGEGPSMAPGSTAHAGCDDEPRRARTPAPADRRTCRCPCGDRSCPAPGGTCRGRSRSASRARHTDRGLDERKHRHSGTRLHRGPADLFGRLRVRKHDAAQTGQPVERCEVVLPVRGPRPVDPHPCGHLGFAGVRVAAGQGLDDVRARRILLVLRDGGLHVEDHRVRLGPLTGFEQFWLGGVHEQPGPDSLAGSAAARALRMGVVDMLRVYCRLSLECTRRCRRNAPGGDTSWHAESTGLNDAKTPLTSLSLISQDEQSNGETRALLSSP